MRILALTLSLLILCGCHSAQSRTQALVGEVVQARAWLARHAQDEGLKADPENRDAYFEDSEIQVFRVWLWLETEPALELRVYHYHPGWRESRKLPPVWEAALESARDAGLLPPEPR